MTYDPGEEPRNPDHEAAKKRAKEILDDPKHHKPKGSPEDEKTVDGDIDEQ